MKQYLKIITILIILVFISGCIINPVPRTEAKSITQYKVLKIDGKQIYYFDENNNIKIQNTAGTYFIESDETILEKQNLNVYTTQYVLYINISKQNKVIQ